MNTGLNSVISSDHTAQKELLTAAEVTALDRHFAEAGTEALLQWAWDFFGPRAAIGTSFQGAGIVIMHLARKAGLNFPVFTLDTGLLFEETIELKQRLEQFFGIQIESLEPDLSVEMQARTHGPDLWQRNPDLCCTMRKVLPLQSKLADLDCWITGLRRQQSETRDGIGMIELYVLNSSAGRNIVKLNPLAHWSRDAVWDHIRKHNIPYNPLQDQGYRSIGCRPCTKRAANGAGERAGRWTGFNKTECGIHTFLPKKVDFQI